MGDAEQEFKKGQPVAALQVLKKAADALGMKGEVYNVFWPPAPVSEVRPVLNPMSVSERRYLDAAAAVTNFRESPMCKALPQSRDAADLYSQYAAQEYEAGRPVEAMEELKKAADELGMSGGVYNVFWPPKPQPVPVPQPIPVPVPQPQPVIPPSPSPIFSATNPVSDAERKYLDAASSVRAFIKSQGRPANDPGLIAAELNFGYAQNEYEGGQPESALQMMQKAADAIGMKGEVYNVFWPPRMVTLNRQLALRA